MRMAHSLKLLLALLLLRLESGSGFKSSHSGCIWRDTPPLSPLRVASSTWATSNDGLAASRRASIVSSPTDARAQKAKAPLVDSTLLRFLSSQKKSGSLVPPNSATGQLKSASTYADSLAEEETVAEVEVQSIAPDSLMEADLTPTTEIDEAQKSIESQSWLSQYNAQKVALKLQALGVDETTSLNTGKVVQDYVLARVTRRRIRKFLQERDASWEAGNPLPFDRSGMKENISPSTTSNYDLDGVLSVMTEYGLTGIDISAIFSHTPSVAMMKARSVKNEASHADFGPDQKGFTLAEALESALVGLLGDTLNLRRYDARKVLRACPGLLTSRGSESAQKVVNLMVSLGSSTNAIARDKTALPVLLSRSPALIFRLVAFLSSAQFKVPLSAIGPILRQKQSREMLDAVAPLRKPLTLGNELDETTNKNLTDSEAESEILGYFKLDNTLRKQNIERSYQSMETIANVLRLSAGIRDFRQILSSYPHMFFLNVTDILHVTNFLKDEAGMTREDVGKAIQSFPTLLEQDVDKMRAVVEQLQILEVEEDALPAMLRSFPATLLLDTERDVAPVVSFLRDIGIRNIGRFVTRLPPVLGYSVENDLQPKWNFLKEVCQFDYFEVARFPAYFSYPLERVIKMRYNYLKDCKDIPIQFVRVDDVLRFGDRDFATEIALDDDNGAAFAKYVEENSSASRSTRTRQKNKKR
ncbi:hypothetical protein ACHAWO_009973 [Cyclotella atomus]|uniref:mTERF domain-containing protein 1, mitochondrial n=1 Tax=Cyclotella atomus TaxID=382360 RepID=A0ABD3QIP0_9STRA